MSELLIQRPEPRSTENDVLSEGGDLVSLEEKREQKKLDIDKEQYFLYYQRMVSTGKALPFKEQLIFDDITDRLSEAREKNHELDSELTSREQEILQEYS